jgi:hypothetical protein
VFSAGAVLISNIGECMSKSVFSGAAVLFESISAQMRDQLSRIRCHFNGGMVNWAGLKRVFPRRVFRSGPAALGFRVE